MSIDIPSELQEFIQQQVASGQYQSEAEVIRAGLCLLREQRLESLRRDIDVGLQDIERGQVIEVRNAEQAEALFDDVKARGAKRLAAEHN